MLSVIQSEPQAFIFIQTRVLFLMSRRQGPFDVRVWQLDMFSYRTAFVTFETG